MFLPNFIPSLPKESIVAMDNAAFHKNQDIKKLIRNAKLYTLVYLSEYSLDIK